MYGDNNLFESMINDFEAIENDSNKNVDEEAKRCPECGNAIDFETGACTQCDWHNSMEEDGESKVEEGQRIPKISDFSKLDDDDLIDYLDHWERAKDSQEAAQVEVDRAKAEMNTRGVHMQTEAKNESKVNEGEFSWLAGDTNEPIYSTEGHQKTVYMLDDKGNKWTEDAYEGYGVFGGKDFYVLLAEMNGLDLTGDVQKDRELGIDLFFNAEDNDEGVKQPRFTTDENIPYEDLPNPENHENQGWYEEESDSDDLEYGDEYESKVVEGESFGGEMVGPHELTDEEFDMLISGLEEFSDISPDPDMESYQGQSNVTIVFTDGEDHEAKRFIGVDPQGYNYARYKTAVVGSADEVMNQASLGCRGWSRKSVRSEESNKGATRMYGDKTEFEGMINDFEAIEADENKDVDEEATNEDCGKDHSVEEGLADEYVVTAQSFDRVTGNPSGDSRDEVINTKDNTLFKNANTILDIKKAYEEFWNDLNPSSKDVVFVSSIKASTTDPSDFDEPGAPESADKEEVYHRRDEQSNEDEVKEEFGEVEDIGAGVEVDTTLPKYVLKELSDAWELIGSHDQDPHTRSMSDDKAAAYYAAWEKAPEDDMLATENKDKE